MLITTLVALVQHLQAVADDAELGPGPRLPHLEDLAGGTDRVAGPDRLQPAQLVAAGRAHADLGREDACLEEQAERDGDGVNAARDDPAVGPLLGAGRIDMEGLRIVAEGEVQDLRLAQGLARGLEARAGLHVLEIPVVHGETSADGRLLYVASGPPPSQAPVARAPVGTVAPGRT